MRLKGKSLGLMGELCIVSKRLPSVIAVHEVLCQFCCLEALLPPGMVTFTSR